MDRSPDLLFRIGPGIVRSNTRKVHSSVTPSAAQQLSHRLHPNVGI